MKEEYIDTTKKYILETFSLYENGLITQSEAFSKLLRTISIALETYMEDTEYYQFKITGKRPHEYKNEL